jgi:hypothetical protein
MNNLKCGREVASSWIFNNSFMPQVTDIELSYSTRLYRGEEARPRVSVELHTLDIDITRLRRTPELKQNIPARTTTSSIIAF